MKYKLFDRVALIEDVKGLRAGASGTVVEQFPNTDGLVVEFFDESGDTVAVLTLDVASVRKLTAGARSKTAP